MTVVLEAPPVIEGVQYRAAVVEHFDADEGTVLMRAVPYNHEVEVKRRVFESFAPRAFEKAATGPPHRVKLWHDHNGPLIGHAQEVEDRPDGLWVRAKFSDTLAAKEARELARDGTLDQASITFDVDPNWFKVTTQTDGAHVRHSRAFLRGVALVAHGAYMDAAYVASVRSADQADVERELRRARILAWNA